jgi:hypothetical protein
MSNSSSSNPLFARLNKVMVEGIQKVVQNSEEEQIRLITMKELTEMPVENLRNLYN